jgi:RimJ/RimL family protein N-acetyltransferase
MVNNYNCLKQQIYFHNNYKLIPIRNEDRYLIMKWRNEQMYHLRQNKQLTKEDQDSYFENVVATLFSKEQPEQILFSFLKDGELIGYGGLVHINWVDKNAEISFLMNTELESDHFEEYWLIYLGLIEKIAFQQLSFHKIFTYAFDLRSKLYYVLEAFDYQNDAILKDHCFVNGVFKNVVIHSKWNLI